MQFTWEIVMKYLLLLGVLGVSITAAQAQPFTQQQLISEGCKILSDKAKTIMLNKQKGVTAQQAYKANDREPKAVKDKLDYMVSEAYREPNYITPERKAKQVEQFKTMMFEECSSSIAQELE